MTRNQVLRYLSNLIFPGFIIFPKIWAIQLFNLYHRHPNKLFPAERIVCLSVSRQNLDYKLELVIKRHSPFSIKFAQKTKYDKTKNIQFPRIHYLHPTKFLLPAPDKNYENLIHTCLLNLPGSFYSKTKSIQFLVQQSNQIFPCINQIVFIK